MRGEEEKNPRSKLYNTTLQYRRSKIEPHRLMAQGALFRQYKDDKNNSKWERTIGCVLPCHGNIA
jgi:hypothetical protein